MEAARIYAIADRDHLGATELPEAVEALAEAGVGWIQVRSKHASGGEIYDLVEQSLRRIEGSGAALWVNDRVDVAAVLPVAGVHLGQEDLSPTAARFVLGFAPQATRCRPAGWGTLCRIGRSTHDEAQLQVAIADPDVDVVAVGPIFATRSKEGADPVVGLEILGRARQWIRQFSSGPRKQRRKILVAIGGITEESLVQVLRAGADAVALIGALGNPSEIAYNARRLLRLAEEAG